MVRCKDAPIRIYKYTVNEMQDLTGARLPSLTPKLSTAQHNPDGDDLRGRSEPHLPISSHGFLVCSCLTVIPGQ
jgi:hypothetical protein